MGAIYLVRHGQAAFGTDDYDRLTEIGYTQAHLLGGFLAVRRVRFEAIYTGTLRRHTETLRAILDGDPAIGESIEMGPVISIDSSRIGVLKHRTSSRCSTPRWSTGPAALAVDGLMMRPPRLGTGRRGSYR